MEVSLERIKELNRDIGLGTYGESSAIRYEIALSLLSDQCKGEVSICEIGPGGVIAYVAEYTEARASAIVSPLESHWDDVFKTRGIALHRWDLNTSLQRADLHETFDCIVFLETLEHLNRWPEMVLEDIRKLLRPGGVLLMSTPNLVRLSNRVRMLLGRPPSNPFKFTPEGMYHVREFTLSELQDFLPKDRWELVFHSFELPHALRHSPLVAPFLFLFKPLLATIIFIKAIKKSDA